MLSWIPKVCLFESQLAFWPFEPPADTGLIPRVVSPGRLWLGILRCSRQRR
jgi:hypothetical protein